MNGLLREILTIQEVRELVDHIAQKNDAVSVTGTGSVQRAQIAAAIRHDTKRPLLMLCENEKEAQRQCADLRILTSCEPVLLPGREWQFHPAVAASREWEYRRLAALYRLAQSETDVIVTTVDALVSRCCPPEVLRQSALTLRIGERHNLNELVSHLVAAGYTRTEQVEGAGQFALRGGILDIYSPHGENAVRCEFFDDEIDSLGAFDVTTQRRIYNCDEVTLLPAGEVLPLRNPEEVAGRLEQAAQKLSRKENTETVCRTLRTDAENLRQGIVPNGIDRYLAAVYEEKICAIDYLPENCVICVSESGRVQETLRGWLWQLKEDIALHLEGDAMCGEFGALALTESELAARLSKFPVCQMESLSTSRALLPPKELWQISTKQLSTYGGSLETAATDILHYLTTGYRVTVLCGEANKLQVFRA